MYSEVFANRVAATANLIGESGERLTGRSPFLLGLGRASGDASEQQVLRFAQDDRSKSSARSWPEGQHYPSVARGGTPEGVPFQNSSFAIGTLIPFSFANCFASS